MRRAITVLRRHGYRLTPQRRAVLETIAGTEEHLTPADIHGRARRDCAGVGLVTVYRTLDVLTRLGLVCEVRTEDGHRSYLLTRPLEHHHHLVCSSCGKVVDFTECDLSELEERLSQRTGFRIDGHVLEFSGHCPSCQGNA